MLRRHFTTCYRTPLVLQNAVSVSSSLRHCSSRAAAASQQQPQQQEQQQQQALAPKQRDLNADELRVQSNERRDISKQASDAMSGEILFKRKGSSLPNEASDKIAPAARANLSKITVTKDHIVQQSGSWHTRGDVVGQSEAGVPIVQRDPDVAVPESYCAAEELTDTYFELPEGFDQNRFYLEIARENLPLISLWSLGMLAYWYSWPAIVGWPATLGGIAAVQRGMARFGCGSVNKKQIFSDEAMRGKICVVTGASSGIGLVTAIELAMRGADVICSTRRPVSDFWKQWDAAVPRNLSKEDREALSKRVSVAQLDLCEFHSVRQFADFVKDRLLLHAKAHGRARQIASSTTAPPASASAEGKTTEKKGAAAAAGVNKPQQQQPEVRYAPAPLDILVNNASLMTPKVEMTSLNFEKHIAANVLGPIFLTELLLPNIRQAAKPSAAAAASAAADKDKSSKDAPSNGLGRIINVTSMAHVAVTEPALVQRELIPRTFDQEKFNFSKRYAVTKLLNIWYSDSLARRGVRAVSVAPGGVATSFFRENAPSIQAGGWAHYPSLMLLRTPREGANNVLYAALCRDEHFVAGALYANGGLCKHGKSWMAVNDRERAEFMDWAKGQLPLKSLDD